MLFHPGPLEGTVRQTENDPAFQVDQTKTKTAVQGCVPISNGVAVQTDWKCTTKVSPIWLCPRHYLKRWIFQQQQQQKKISNAIPRAKCGLNWSKPVDSLKQHEKPVSWWQLVILKLSWKINGEILKKKCRLPMTGTDNLLMQFPIAVCAIGRNGWAKWHTAIQWLHFLETLALKSQ